MKALGTWIKVGVRNLAKNRRRSAATMLAIALGFAAVNVFGGFTAYVFKGLEDSWIYAQGNGHLTVFRRGMMDEGVTDPTRYLMSAAQIEAVGRVCLSDPRVVLVTPQLQISGLISNGRASAIFVATGRVPSDHARILRESRSFIARIKLFDGEMMRDEHPEGVGLSRGLAGKLDLKLGSDAIIMAPTVEGQINALDVNVWNVFDSAAEVLNDKIMAVTIKLARGLYDTEGADRLSVLLRRTSDTQAVMENMRRVFAERGLGMEVRPWDETAVSFRKIRNMFNIIFSFLFVIVLVIVILSVVNTIGMAVMERTREIGTLRSLGLRRRGVVIMFATESALLGIFGSAAGVALTLAAWTSVKLIGPTWIPPTYTTRIPLEIHLVGAYMVTTLVFLVMLAVAGAAVPSRRAARMNITDALGHI